MRAQVCRNGYPVWVSAREVDWLLGVCWGMWGVARYREGRGRSAVDSFLLCDVGFGFQSGAAVSCWHGQPVYVCLFLPYGPALACFLQQLFLRCCHFPDSCVSS